MGFENEKAVVLDLIEKGVPWVVYRLESGDP
jgi:hypothetical protein